jgi:hypothetical protein
VINVSAYPLCAKRLHFQNVNFTDDKFTKYWAAVNVAFDLPDTQLTHFGGFDFSDRSDKNGAKLLSRLEEFLIKRGQRLAGNNFAATEALKALLGSRGIKTSMLKSEDDYWTAAEILFSGRIKRNGGLTSLYTQIHAIPKKQRKALANENLRKLPADWLSSAPAHLAKLSPTTANEVAA